MQFWDPYWCEFFLEVSEWQIALHIHDKQPEAVEFDLAFSSLTEEYNLYKYQTRLSISGWWGQQININKPYGMSFF